ncbi:MAG: discoidin domain-containing protein [Sedimenticola sp.]|nr:discoidin domain-containing protein [Sedimenticola sp.]
MKSPKLLALVAALSLLFLTFVSHAAETPLWVEKVTASSHAAGHPPEQANDRDKNGARMDAAWVAGPNDASSAGQWIKYDFGGEVEVSRIVITNAWHTEKFKVYGRIKRFTLAYSDGTVLEYSGPTNGKGTAYYTGIRKARWVKLTIHEIYPGASATTGNQVAINLLAMYGNRLSGGPKPKPKPAPTKAKPPEKQTKTVAQPKAKPSTSSTKNETQMAAVEKAPKKQKHTRRWPADERGDYIFQWHAMPSKQTLVKRKPPYSLIDTVYEVKDAFSSDQAYAVAFESLYGVPVISDIEYDDEAKQFSFILRSSIGGIERLMVLNGPRTDHGKNEKSIAAKSASIRVEVKGEQFRITGIKIKEHLYYMFDPMDRDPATELEKASGSIVYLKRFIANYPEHALRLKAQRELNLLEKETKRASQEHEKKRKLWRLKGLEERDEKQRKAAAYEAQKKIMEMVCRGVLAYKPHETKTYITELKGQVHSVNGDEILIGILTTGTYTPDSDEYRVGKTVSEHYQEWRHCSY